MNVCFLCQKSVRIVRFKCLDGYVCKNCYAVVSKSFSSTIRNKTRGELESMFRDRVVTDFEITRDINHIVSVDAKSKTVCLSNNSRYFRETREPEFFKFADIVRSWVREDKATVNGKSLGTIGVVVELSGEPHVRNISLIPNPISTTSAIYRNSLALAAGIVREVNGLRDLS